MLEDLATGKTVVDNTLTDDATLSDDSLRSPSGAPPQVVLRPDAPLRTNPSLQPSATLRTTVLPRTEVIEGARATITHEVKPRYALAHRLGQGGVGDVIKAHDNDIERPVAIKRIRSDAKSHATLMRFAEEIRTIGNLEHPNIVPIHDVGLDQHGEHYFVMKYVEGETLETIIEKLAGGDRAYHAKYGFERRVEIMMGVLDAVQFAHANGVIHRDIKPANIMIGPYGEVMVMDWGLARKIKGEEAPITTPSPQGSVPPPSKRRLFETQVGTLLGTPAYMSPEQARGEALDEKSDIYSLCVTFYELITLVHPLEEKKTLESMLAAVVGDEVPPAWTHRRGGQSFVPADLAWFVAGGLQKDPARRYASVTVMLARLRDRAEGNIPVQCPFTLAMRATMMARRAINRHPIMSLGAVGLLLVWTIAATAFTIVRAMHG